MIAVSSFANHRSLLLFHREKKTNYLHSRNVLRASTTKLRNTLNINDKRQTSRMQQPTARWLRRFWNARIPKEAKAFYALNCNFELHTLVMQAKNTMFSKIWIWIITCLLLLLFIKGSLSLCSFFIT